MAVYEYFCRTCNSRYEKRRPMRDADAVSTCPSCNTENSVRTLSLFVAVTGSSESHSSTRDDYAMGGGCACGGACGCASKN